MSLKTVFADSYGYSASNATQALQQALNDPTVNRVIVRNMGNPWWVSQTVFVPSNKTIVFQPGVVVQAKPGAFRNNTLPMFRAVNVENVNFIGLGEGAMRATFKMNKAEFNPNQEYSHALALSGVTNFRVEGLKFTGAGGDGLYIDGADSAGKTYSENGIVRNIIASNNRRQGLSVISAKNLTIQNSVFENTNGTAPSAGIDFEPDKPSQRLQNIRLNNLEFRNNRGAGLKFALGNLTDSSAPVSIFADNLWIEQNQSSGIAFQLWGKGNDPAGMPNGQIVIRNTQVIASGGRSGIETYASGLLFQDIAGPRYDPNNLRINLNRVSIANSSNDSGFYNPIHLRGFGGTDNTQAIGNVRFRNVVVRDQFRRDIIRGIHGRPDGYLEQISGNIVGFNPTGVTLDYDPETRPRNVSLVTRNGDQLTGGNLVRNGGFEQGRQNWQFTGTPQLVADQGPFRSRWLKIDALTGLASQAITTGLQPGQDYVLSGEGALAQAGAAGSIGIRYWDADGNVITTDWLPFKSTQLLELSLGFTTPNDFSRAELFVQKNKGVGAFWVDDIRLVAQQGGIVPRGF